MIELWLLIGGLVGAVNGLTRWWVIARLGADMEGGPLMLTLGGMMVRLALVAALLAAGLQRGIIPGLLAFGGLWLVRSASLIWIQIAEVSWPSDLSGEDGNSPMDVPKG